MAIALVQSKSASDTSDASSLAAVFDSSPTEGNLMVAAWGSRDGSTRTATPPSGWAAAVELAVDYLSIEDTVSIFYKIAEAAESSTVTLTYSAAINESTIHIMEFSDIAAVPLDVVASNDETGGTSLVADTGTTGVTAQAAALAIAACVFGDDDFDASADEDWSDSYTHSVDIAVVNTYAHTLGVGYKVLSATGTQNTTLTRTTGGAEERWSAIAVFKGVAVAGANPKGPLGMPLHGPLGGPI